MTTVTTTGSAAPATHLSASSPSSTSSSQPLLTPLTLPPLSANTSLRDSLLSFLSLQEQRARTYHEWDSAFRVYLEHKDEAHLHSYTALCQQVTQHFQLLSLHIKLLIAHVQLLPPSSPPSTPPARLAALMESVQNEEREKLRLCIEQQQLASEWVVVRKEPFAGEFHEAQTALRERQREVVEAINDLLTDLRYEVAYKKRPSKAAEADAQVVT